jgi:hypothetical protein
LTYWPVITHFSEHIVVYEGFCLFPVDLIGILLTAPLSCFELEEIEEGLEEFDELDCGDIFEFANLLSPLFGGHWEELAIFY